MTRSVRSAAAALPAVLASLAWSTISLAQSAPGHVPPPARAVAPPSVILLPPPRDVVVVEEKTPNFGLITAGAVMFGVPYTTSVIVAAASDRASDHSLYIPLVGPWIDLGRRGQCTTLRCDGETGNKVLLVVDGIFQGVGALQMLGGFVFPSTRTVTRTAGVHVTPTAGLSSVGLAAFGSF